MSGMLGLGDPGDSVIDAEVIDAEVIDES